jgi:hypothetical protein
MAAALLVKSAAMSRRHVLAALDAGIAAGDEDAARAALRRVDPVARTFARRTLERSLIDAALACDAAQLATPPPRHVMQVAALTLAKRGVAAGDVDGAATAYARLPKRAMPRLPLATLATLLVAASLIAGSIFYVTRALEKPSRTFVRDLPPPSADAFDKGGVPLRDAALDRLLSQRLTDLVVDGGRARNDRDNNLDARLKALRAPDPILAHGVALTKAWDQMLAVFAASVEAGRGKLTSRQRDELEEAVRDVTRELHAQGLGYVLEGRFKAGYPYIQAYKIEEIVFVKTADAPRRVLSVRRLDRLSTAYAALGMHDEDKDPVLHLERIDENVASDVMPVLAEGAAYPLGDREWLLTDPGKPLAAKVGEVVRREYEAALGADAKAVDEIANLLAKRNDIVDEWRDHLERKRIFFVRTANLFLPPDLLDQLEDVTPNYQRNRVREIEDRLAALEAPRIHARLHDLVSASVRRHEAQHGYDYDRDTELRYPAPLMDFLGSPHDAEGNPIAVVRSARAELAAYLSQIANDPVTPQASLWHVAIQVFHRARRGTSEYYAGIVLLEGIARQLGAALPPARVVTRERLAKAAHAIADAPADKLRAAAAALWTELYGEPLTTIVDVPRRTVLARTN